MRRKTRLRILIILNMLVFIPVIIDVLLHVFDVWGAHRYFDDLNTLVLAFENEPVRGFRITPGVHTFLNWTAAVLEDGTRFVPQTMDAGCTLVTLGDSVTFGHGVNDGETYTAQLARDFPDIRWVNAGIEGYNAEQVLQTRHMIAGDGYVYLLINNDADARVEPIYIDRPLYRLSLPLYWRIWQGKHNLDTGLPQDFAAFDRAITELKQDDSARVFGIEGDALAARAGVTTIPPWTAFNSFTDPHPNAAGHLQIASWMHDTIAVFVEQQCEQE